MPHNTLVDNSDTFGVIPDVDDTNIITHDCDNIGTNTFSGDLDYCNDASHELDELAPNHNSTSAPNLESSTSGPLVPNDIAFITNPSRRSVCNVKQPGYLHFCNLLRNTPTASTIPHYFGKHLSYDWFSHSLRHFIFKVGTTYEPIYYHQAVKYPHWHQAMT